MKPLGKGVKVILKLAEFANENGKTAEACTEWKAILARVGIDQGVDNLYRLKVGMNQADMRTAIRLECEVEFAFEAKRFWSLRSWRLFESTLN